MTTDILADLNTKQREAVETIDGPLLIVAGPGSGKTHTVNRYLDELELADRRSTEILREGKEKAQGFVTQAQKRGDEIIEAAKLDAQEEAERIKIAAAAEIEQNRNRARDELRSQVAKLALAGAEQVLMREVDEQAHREVLDKLAADL